MSKSRFPQWPKPSPILWCSFFFLVINGALFYLLTEMNWSYWFLTPFVLFNVFFIFAECDIYRRERRNFDNWVKEMKDLMGEDFKPASKWRWRMTFKPRKRPKRRPYSSRNHVVHTEQSEPWTI